MHSASKLSSSLFCLCSGLLIFLSSLHSHADTQVRLTTTLGVIEIQLYDQQAPKSAANFLSYVDQKFYDGLIFHRVMKNFMIQTGGITNDLQRKKAGKPVANESFNKLANTVGSIAMARTSHPDSATSQFFINLVNNDYLNASNGRPGYTVFGVVSKGMEVVKAIGNAQTQRYQRFANLPIEDIKIIKAERISPLALSAKQ